MSILHPLTDSDVEGSIARILEIMAERSRLLAVGNRTVRYADHVLNVESYELNARLAGEFGRRHGWIRAKSTFWNPEILARRSTTASSMRSGESMGLPHDLFDHAYCYREASRPYRAAGIAAHLYNNSAEHPGDLTERAGRLGLVLSWPDFPSWWYPGHTALALYVTASQTLSRAA
jgi:hypothetical protein